MRSYTRPSCQTPGCCNKAAPTRYRDDGPTDWRKWCGACHNTRTAARHGLSNITQVVAKNAGFDSVGRYLDNQAIAAGFVNHTAKKNSTHKYLKYRKSYCENRDGRLGYECDCQIRIDAQLQVDHIDGNPDNNDPTNLQTLCSNCHIYKTHMNKDYATPGRKALKQKQLDNLVN